MNVAHELKLVTDNNPWTGFGVQAGHLWFGQIKKTPSGETFSTHSAFVMFNESTNDFALEIMSENPKYGGCSGGRVLVRTTVASVIEAAIIIKKYLSKYGSGHNHEQLSTVCIGEGTNS